MLGGDYGVKHREEDPYAMLEKENRISSKKRAHDGQTSKMRSSPGSIDDVDYDAYLMYQYLRDNFYCMQDRQMAVEADAILAKEHHTQYARDDFYRTQDRQVAVDTNANLVKERHTRSKTATSNQIRSTCREINTGKKRTRYSERVEPKTRTGTRMNIPTDIGRTYERWWWSKFLYEFWSL